MPLYPSSPSHYSLIGGQTDVAFDNDTHNKIVNAYLKIPDTFQNKRQTLRFEMMSLVMTYDINVRNVCKTVPFNHHNMTSNAYLPVLC